MIPSLRNQFNEIFSVEKYNQLLEEIEREHPHQLDFRIAETPVFVPQSLKIRILQACNDIIDKLIEPDFKSKTDRAIPSNQYVPNDDSTHPHFLCIDFAICKDEAGDLTPQLIELQGFPSLFGYQPYIGKLYRKHYFSPENTTQFFNRLDEKSYIEEFRKVVVGNENPENVILLEIYPEQQKTRLDFQLTKELWGIEPVCYTKVQKDGRKLYYEKDGRRIEIKRIYNRLIFDDLLQNFPDLETEFKLTDDVEVTWVTHPNWFFRISKYSLPFLKSAFVPESHFVADLQTYPEDLENYVLKPLFSFAGSGVKLNITKQDLDSLTDKENFLLQRKVKYEPIVRDVEGKLIKAELRMLFLWDENAARPKLVTNLARLSRGEMIGVNFNKNFDWVGGSCGFFEE